jgi:hypothetical protein
MSPNATLYYGFMLGCPNDGGWEVAEADEYGDLGEAGLPWVEAAEDEDDYESHMCLAIFISMGIEAADVPSSELNEALAKRCGVEVVQCGSSPADIMHFGIALAGSVHRADDYTPKAIAPNVGVTGHEPLHAALRALGLSPNQVNPSWILAPGEG